MPSEDLRALIARANNDKDFLRQLLTNPEAAVKDAGFELSPDEMDAVKSSQFKEQLSDEELENRTSKIFFKIGG
jgi:predicted ribosomally synthesized peptide with nif11-like leader